VEEILLFITPSMRGSMVDIQSAAAENRQGKKTDTKKKPHGKNIMSTSATQGGHNKNLHVCMCNWMKAGD